MPCREACAAAASLAGHRFLCAEAPLLPLRDCDRPDGCRCAYRHLADRREGKRRHESSFLSERRPGGEERRRRSGRRADDDAHDSFEDTYYGYMTKKRLRSRSKRPGVKA